MIIHVAGELDFTTAAALRSRAVTAALAVRCVGLVLDLGEVTFCDSSGLGALVGIWKAVRAEGGSLLLARPSEPCRRLLARTGVGRYLTAHDTLAAAIVAVCRSCPKPDTDVAAG